MKKLIALLALAGAVAGAVFFWRRNEKSWSSWCSAKGTGCSWGKPAREASSATDQLAAAADGLAEAASDLADQVKGNDVPIS
jgi:hypothetical protein